MKAAETGHVLLFFLQCHSARRGKRIFECLGNESYRSIAYLTGYSHTCINVMIQYKGEPGPSAVVSVDVMPSYVLWQWYISR